MFALEEESMNGISFRPTLVVGLGGSGYGVLLRLKSQIQAAFGKIPSCVSFLSIDTTEPEESSIPTADGTAMSLDQGSERYIVQLANTTGYIDDPHIARWWPGDLPKTAISAGATQVRARGRLSLFADFSEISGRLREKIDRITDIRTARRMVAEGFQTSDRNGVEVYIISSLAGGTGSGMVLDVAFIVRSMIDEISRISGVLLLPRIFDRQAPSIVRANSYGALKEIEFFMKIKGRERYEVDYGNARIEVKAPPFDWLYLIDNVNGGNGGKNKNTIGDLTGMFKLVARGVFVHIASPIGTKRTNDLDNLKGNLSAASRIRGRSASYCSFGIASLAAPVGEFHRAAKAREVASARNLLDKLLDYVTPEVLPTEAAARLQRQLGLDKPVDELARDFITTESGEVIGSSIVLESVDRRNVLEEAASKYSAHLRERQHKARGITERKYDLLLEQTKQREDSWLERTVNTEGGL